MTQRDERESSVDEWLSRGADFRREISRLLRGSDASARPLASRSERQAADAGTLSGSLAWLERLDPAADATVLEAFGWASPLLDALAAGLLRSLTRAGDLATLTETTPPIVLTVGRSRAIRVGLFDWSTDRDAFITALLGRPVPRLPRYASAGPGVPIRFTADLMDLEEAWGVAVLTGAEFYGLDRERAARSAGQLARVVAGGAAADDLASSALVARLVEMDPVGFANAPWGQMLLGAVRAARQWRTPPIAHEFALTVDLGAGGPMGFALWMPGAIELRRHRRVMAAHLRFLFDTHVAPHQRFAEARIRREALILWWRTAWPTVGEGRPPSLRQVALGLRLHFPADYEGEPEAATLRRVYRRSASLRRTAGTNRTTQPARRPSSSARPASRPAGPRAAGQGDASVRAARGS